jgi:trk system potassium uptake protein TrkH
MSVRHAAGQSPGDGPRRRPGNVVLRRQRLQREVVRVRPRRQLFRFRPSPWYIVVAFAGTIGVGTLLLSLPAAAESREWTNGWNALFTATSAVSVTGLVRVDTATHWSGFGEAVILALIQVGGLSVTMYAGALLIVLGRRFGLRGNALFGMELASAGEWNIGVLLRRVLAFMLIIELLTFLFLLPWFIDHFDGANAVWRAFFHAISAANNAGFDVMGGFRGFTEQIGSPYPLAVMGVSAFIGSLSFVSVFDLRRGIRRWSLDTRFVFIGMGGLLILGILAFVIGEVQGGRSLDGLGAAETVVNGFFLSVNRTTGMSTVDMAGLQDLTTSILLPLMFIGGASTSVAGGIKIGAFMVSIAVVWSSLRGRHRAEAFGRVIPQAIVLRAIAVILLFFAMLMAGLWTLEITDDVPFLSLVFETTSALANVGWSHGVTPGLSTAGSLVLVVLMFAGRIGPLMIALTVPERPQERYRYAEEGVRIG